ncbi:hypothetical protein C0993_011421, partial [Termitomyces sp. T159_Od127]
LKMLQLLPKPATKPTCATLPCPPCTTLCLHPHPSPSHRCRCSHLHTTPLHHNPCPCHPLAPPGPCPPKSKPKSKPSQPLPHASACWPCLPLPPHPRLPGKKQS